MDKLISDRAQTEIGKRALDILRALFISSWQSEPHQQQQNPAERKYQTLNPPGHGVKLHPTPLRGKQGRWILCHWWLGSYC